MATPTLTDLQTACARDLRDTSKKTFKDPDLTDLINAGIEEVGRVYPREALVTITPLASTYEYPTTLQQVFRAEVWRGGKMHGALANGADEPTSQVGWELWAGSIRLPVGMADALAPASDTLRLWGYEGYPQLSAGADESFLDDSGEWGVRRYVRATAYQQLHGDRALFKQWQAQSQNSDVSMNMLSQMVGFYTSEWDRTRNHLRRLRRV